MSRSEIDRLTRRIEALEAQRKFRRQRVFTILIENHMKRDQELARFRAEHGVSESDVVTVQTLIPYEQRAGETAKESYERELASIAKARTEAQTSAENATVQTSAENATARCEGAPDPRVLRGGATETIDVATKRARRLPTDGR
jgi:hypothetical protein